MRSYLKGRYEYIWYVTLWDIFLHLLLSPSLCGFFTHERALPEVPEPEQDLVQYAASSDTKSVQRHHRMLVIRDLLKPPHWGPSCSLPPGAPRNRNCYASVQSSWHIGWRWQEPSYPPRLHHRKLPSPVSHTWDGEFESLLVFRVGGVIHFFGGWNFSKNMYHCITMISQAMTNFQACRWFAQSWRESLGCLKKYHQWFSLRELLRTVCHWAIELNHQLKPVKMVQQNHRFPTEPEPALCISFGGRKKQQTFGNIA